jgi:hypothetical protein
MKHNRGVWRAGLAGGVALLAGCGGDNGIRTTGLDPEAFRAAPGSAPSSAGDGKATGPRPVIVAREEAAPPHIDLAAIVEPPAEPDRPSANLGGPVLVDSKIGDVNGQPVWASEIFDELFSAHLRKEASKLSPEEWTTWASSEIELRLQFFIEDVILREEGLATLTPDQKRGWLQHVTEWYQENQKSKNMGSEMLANRSAQENQRQYYESLDAQTRDWMYMVLIERTRQRLDDTVNISTAAKRRYYDKHPELFDPPPVAEFSMILVDGSRPGDADLVRWALESGAAFADVASLPLNAYKQEAAGQMAPKEFGGDYAGAELFARPAVNDAARALQPGEWTGPVEYSGGDLAFVRLDGIRDARLSLYDAQLAIEQELHEAEFKEKKAQMIERLKRRSSLTDQTEMRRRLLEIAQRKFLPPGSY